MGVAQSSKMSDEAAYANNGKGQALPKGITPSLALWADDHDISAEDLAQAYGLAATGAGGRGRVKVGAAAAAAVGGTAADAMAQARADDRENAGLTQGLAVGKYVGVDCEMVGVAGARGDESALARVSIVDFFGRQVYDSYVRLQPAQRVTDWRTAVSGITPRHMRLARPFDEVQAAVRGLLAGEGQPDHQAQEGRRVLVGHDVRHDLEALGLQHPPALVRDTVRFSGFRQYGHGPKPALRAVARAVLGVEIQQGAHSSVEDARVAMQLYRRHKPAMDVESANRWGGGLGKKRR